jgi:hypothetical protein
MGLGRSLKKAAGSFGQFFGMPGGGGGGDSSGEAMAAEEARKAALRAKIDAFYGIGDPNAAAQLAAENAKIGDSTRAYYTDQLGERFGEAERSKRFALARKGQLGGSVQVDEMGELAKDRDMGATRIDDAVRSAVANLSTQRERERLNAINLVNSGAGDSAVTAAHTGLRNAFDNVSSQQKTDLFGDILETTAGGMAGANNEAALLSRYRNQLSSFFPSSSGKSGRITPLG